MTDDIIRRAGRDLAFERKVQLSVWALAFERLWLRLWLVIVVIAAFVVVSLAGLWPLLGPGVHAALLAAFGLALIAALGNAARIKWPTRDEAVRRIERKSGVPHRPASSYEDTLSAGRGDPATMAIWAAHRQRLAEMLARLRVGTPEPRTDRYDPRAFRVLMSLVVLALAAVSGAETPDRLREAFRIGGRAALDKARLDAWVAPPAYTLRPPMMLADGAKPGGLDLTAQGGIVEVPERSIIIVRSSGAENVRLALELPAAGKGLAERIESNHSAGATQGVSEVRHEIRGSGRIRVLVSGTEVAAWTFAVVPDAVPEINLTKDLERTARGSMKVHFKASDDYGVASAAARFEKAKRKPGDPTTAWARNDLLKGPRPPLERPPVLALRLPKINAKDVEGSSYLELAEHPWAGLHVVMRLEAKDVAGQTGLSSPIELQMPQRRFEKPLARAVVEQRRKLVDDPRHRGQVLRALEALSIGPEVFGVEPRVYLLMRSAQHRLARDTSRAGRKSVIDQLWHIALKIEDGDLSDAEKRLRDAQDKLSKALENGASEEEIRQLMQEMRQALNDYMRELQKQAEANGQEQQDGQDPNNQTLSQQDLDRMMKNIEEMAKNGAREQAQQMLSELRDLMERMQTGRMAEEKQRQNREAMQKMEELGSMVGEQQKLMDDTFSEMREQDQPGQRPQQRPGQQPRPGQKGQAQQGQKGQPLPGQKGQQQGQQGQGQQQGQRGEGRQTGESGREGKLGQRQGDLRDRLGRLQREMRDLGMGDSEQLQSAREAMENAERALREGDLSEATEEQGRALDEMRQGAQQMAQEMMKNMPQRFGQNGDTPRDPLGRPQRSEGPDQGTSVKVPEEIEMQRAREILDELRRRSGEAARPPIELDYLERLLKRF